MSEAAKEKKLGRPISVVEDEIRNDPNTKEIAETLGMEFEDYVASVMDFVKNPNKEPQLQVYDDAELAQYEGERPATAAEITDWMKQVDAGEISLGGGQPSEAGSQFDDNEDTATQRKARSVTGAAPSSVGPRADPGSALRGQVSKDKGPVRGVKRGIPKKAKEGESASAKAGSAEPDDKDSGSGEE